MEILATHRRGTSQTEGVALDIVLTDSVLRPMLSAKHIAFFNENEASFWFLWPLWEQLQHKSGQPIDLYNVAFFGGTDLNYLCETLREARILTQKQEEKWEVVVGWKGTLKGPEVREQLSESEMNALLDDLERAVAKAKQENLYVVFFGD